MTTNSDQHEDALCEDVDAILLMLENGEWAEHSAKTERGKRLEAAITKLHNEMDDLVQASEQA